MQNPESYTESVLIFCNMATNQQPRGTTENYFGFLQIWIFFLLIFG